MTIAEPIGWLGRVPRICGCRPAAVQLWAVDETADINAAEYLAECQECQAVYRWTDVYPVYAREDTL